MRRHRAEYLDVVWRERLMDKKRQQYRVPPEDYKVQDDR
jgi:hypothetical protein